LDRSSHKVDVGPHGIIPANCPPFPQQALLDVVNPAHNSHRWYSFITLYILVFQTKKKKTVGQDLINVMKCTIFKITSKSDKWERKRKDYHIKIWIFGKYFIPNIIIYIIKTIEILIFR